MAKDPEARAEELLKEMAALIENCEQQIEEGRQFRDENGLDEETVKKQVEQLPADKKAELDAAIAQDMREIEDEVARAKLEAEHTAHRPTGKRPKMRPMV